jgi:hypothetical protein
MVRDRKADTPQVNALPASDDASARRSTLVVNARDTFAAAEFEDERAYYSGALGEKLGGAGRSASERTWSAGLAVYDIRNGDAPRQIGFMPVDGGGVHRIWYTGGRWAYVSALLDALPTISF